MAAPSHSSVHNVKYEYMYISFRSLRSWSIPGINLVLTEETLPSGESLLLPPWPGCAGHVKRSFPSEQPSPLSLSPSEPLGLKIVLYFRSVWCFLYIYLSPDRSGVTQILTPQQTGLVTISHHLLTRPVWCHPNTPTTPDRSGVY